LLQALPIGGLGHLHLLLSLCLAFCLSFTFSLNSTLSLHTLIPSLTHLSNFPARCTLSVFFIAYSLSFSLSISLHFCFSVSL
jgi:hypothetical protein